MKIWIKILIAGIVGFGGGFASGFFAHKKINDVKFEEITEEEMKEIEESMSKKSEDIRQSIDDTFDPVNANVDNIADNVDDLRKALQGKTSYMNADQEQKKAYEKMWNATKEYSSIDNANDIPVEASRGVDPDGEDEEGNDEEFDNDFLEEIKDEEADEFQKNNPYRITLTEFYNDRPEYDKVTIDWYEEDNMWRDERDEEILDIESYLGGNAATLYTYAMPGDEQDVRFIRNEQYQSDYEIIRHHRSYTEIQEDR